MTSKAARRGRVKPGRGRGLGRLTVHSWGVRAGHSDGETAMPAVILTATSTGFQSNRQDLLPAGFPGTPKPRSSDGRWACRFRPEL